MLVCLCWVGYGQLLREGHVPYSRYSDDIAHNIATSYVLYEARRRGESAPLWRSDQLVGGVAMTQPQALYTYPLRVFSWWVHPARWVGWAYWLEMLAVAGVFWWVGGALGLSMGARLVMAVGALFQMKFILAIYAGWLAALPGYVWTPLLFGVVFRALQRPDRTSALWMAGVGGLCLHARHLQSLYYTTLLLCLYLCVCGVGWWRKKAWTEAGRVIGGLGAGAILAVGMSAYLMVPLLLESSLSSRVGLSYQEFLADHALEWRHLWTLFFPEALGTPLRGTYPKVELWEDLAYFGGVPLFLAVIGAIWGWRRRFVAFLAISFCGLWVLAQDSVFLRFFYDFIPGFRLFRAPARMLFLASALGLMLAGVGWDVLASWLAEKGKMRWVWIGCAGLLCGMTVEGTWYSRRYVTTRPWAEVFPKADYQAFLAKQQKPFRVLPMGRSTLNSGWAAWMGLEVITGYEPYNYRHYQQLVSLLLDGRVRPRVGVVWTDVDRIARPDVLDLLNVRYVLSAAAIQVPSGSSFWPVAQFEQQPFFVPYGGMRYGEMLIYENRRMFGRIQHPRQVAVVQTEAEMIRWVESHRLRDLAVVLDKSSKMLGATTKAVEVAVPTVVSRIVSWKAGKIDVWIRSEGRRFVRVSEIWHPGWRAVSDGRSVPLLRTDLSLLGFWVDAGEHRISLVFQPLAWSWALGVSGVAGLLWLGLCVGCLVWRRREGAFA